MNALLKSSAGYPIVFRSEDFLAVHYTKKHASASMRDIRKVIGCKVMRIILCHYHGVGQDHVAEALGKTRIIRVTLWENTPKHWGTLVEILYRFENGTGNYRHVFHFIPDNGGRLNGTLFTQTRRFIAK